MVKLPVFVMNRNNQLDVLNNAVQMQSILEAQAMAEYRNGGCYIRPIVLFQAQPKGKEDAATFEKIRTILVKNGIPAKQIAIKTADINELKNADLLSPKCPIRFIITVNALKEAGTAPLPTSCIAGKPHQSGGCGADRWAHPAPALYPKAPGPGFEYVLCADLLCGL